MRTEIGISGGRGSLKGKNKKNKMKIEIRTSDGKTYPCRVTMGALLRFSRTTGKDVSAMDGSVTDMATLIWCCVKSACEADGVKFEYSLEEFSDRIDGDEMNAFGKEMTTGASKKKPAK